MAWKSLALDTYNMYLEKDAISRGSRFTAWISNWFILTGYVILPQTMAAVAREQTTSMRSTAIFKFNVTNIQVFAISCLIVGHVSTIFLCCRYFNNLIFRLETILIPTLSASFVGVISCLFNFVGRRGVAILEANTMALLTFSSVAFVLIAIASISTTVSLHAHRVLARIKYQEKFNHVVSPGYRSGPKTPYSQYSTPSTATDFSKPGRKHEKQHSRNTSASSRKHLLNVFTMGPNPAQESNTTIATFLDSTNSNNNSSNNVVASGNQTRTLGQTLDPHLITQTSTIGGNSHPTSPILHTANFAISVRAPNPAAWKPNQTIHESESRTHSRNTSSVYSFLPDVESQFPQPPENHAVAAASSNINVYGTAVAVAVSSNNSMAKKTHISTSSYATYIPGSEENSPSEQPRPPLPPIPSTSCMTPTTNANGVPGRNTAIANDVADLLNEANQVLIGFTHPSQPHSPSSSHIPSFYKQRETSYAPSDLQNEYNGSEGSQYNRAPSPHPAMFLSQLAATQAAPPSSTAGNQQSQSMFLGELTDCYKYSQYGYPSAYHQAPQQHQQQHDNSNIGRALGPKTPVTNGQGYDFYATGDMRNSIISTGSVSKQRRSKNTSMSSVIELLGRKGSLTEQSYSGGTSEEDRIKEVNMRSPVKNYSGIYV